MKCLASVVTLAGLVAAPASAQLFQPDSAVASSEFSGGYVIENTINGSGLVGGLSLDATHANYTSGNHWTTRRDAQNVNAVFSFNEPQTIARMVLWNHRSNNIADDPGYAMRLFDMTLLDENDAVLASFPGLMAERNEPAAQLFDFAAVSGVRSVRIDIIENYGSRLNGFAEIAFSAVPAPGAAVLLAGGTLLASRRRR